MLIPLSTDYRNVQARLRVWSACGTADRGFLAACDALPTIEPCPMPLVALQDEAFEAAWFMCGFARGQQATTRESATGVRHLAHCEMLPSVEVMR